MKTENLVIGAWKKAVLWDTNKSEERISCELSEDTECMQAAVSADGSTLATVGIRSVELWRFDSGVRTGELLLDRPGNAGSGLAFSHDGRFLVAGAPGLPKSSSRIVVWKLGGAPRRFTFRCHDDPLVAMSFLGETDTLVTAGVKGTVRTWDLNNLPWPPQEKKGRTGEGNVEQ
jgi:WD40 repeat protein